MDKLDEKLKSILRELATKPWFFDILSDQHDAEMDKTIAKIKKAFDDKAI